MSGEGRARVATKMILGIMRAVAKRKGHPLPIIYTCDFEPGPDGGSIVKPGTMRPMTHDEVIAILPYYYD
jgi:hypothetical protein